MYEELVKRLRYCAIPDNQCLECKYRGGSPDGSKMCFDLLIEDAADAIEELTLIAESNERSAARWAETAGKAVERYEELSKRVPPVPHGRLIDADALLDDLLFPSKQFEQGMRELIGDAPTIIEAEETNKEAANDQNNS